ncbi:MAG: single-stranded DNA-binding protein [Candidatus Babeliales bacterium]|jgi:single-strand DNA-binding protein
MASYNRIIMMGNLTRDPELKQLNSGQSVCRLGLASNRQFKNKTGAMVQEVCFVDVDVWGPQADSCRQYLSKGRAVLVEGRLKLDSWQENDGTKRSKHSIVADRVTFLPATAQAEDATAASEASDEFSPATTAKSDAEAKHLRVKKAKPSLPEDGAVAPRGEVALKDEAPFEDDLPF